MVGFLSKIIKRTTKVVDLLIMNNDSPNLLLNYEIEVCDYIRRMGPQMMAFESKQ